MKRKMVILIAACICLLIASGCSSDETATQTPDTIIQPSDTPSAAIQPSDTPSFEIRPSITPSTEIQPSEVVSEPSEPANEELEYFNGDGFFNGAFGNIRNQFLSSLYDSPEKINLHELFFIGAGNGEKASEDEITAVIEQNGWEFKPHTPCTKVSAAAMNDVLGQYMGLTLEETEKIGMDGYTYLEKYDAYYYFHGDSNYRSIINFSAIEKAGDLILLYYEDDFFGDGEKVLTLKPHGDSYLFVSNVMSNK